MGDHKFFDNSVKYSHSDFVEGNTHKDSCIYLNVTVESNDEAVVMISRNDAIAIAKKFQLSFGDIFRGDT